MFLIGILYFMRIISAIVKYFQIKNYKCKKNCKKKIHRFCLTRQHYIFLLTYTNTLQCYVNRGILVVFLIRFRGKIIYEIQSNKQS